MTLKFASHLVLSASLFAAATSPAFAQAKTDSSKQDAKAEKTICKQMPSSYSRHSNKVCLTAEQWKKVESER